MEKTIRKKNYSTVSGTIVKKVTFGYYGDPAGYETTLYITPEGDYFLYVNGGAQSAYPKEDIEALSKVNAKKWIEEHK